MLQTCSVVEGKMNQHVKQFNKMFQVGSKQGQARRVEGVQHGAGLGKHGPVLHVATAPGLLLTSVLAYVC